LHEGVDGGQVGPGRRLDDVGGHPPPGDPLAVHLDLHGHVAKGVGPARDRGDVEVDQLGRHAGRPRDGRAGRVHHAVAEGRLLDLGAVAGQAHGRRRRQHRAPGDLDADQLEGLVVGGDGVGHDRLQVGVGHPRLAVGDLLEADEGPVQGVAGQVEAELGQGVGDRVAAGVLAEDDLGAGVADLDRVHDLVGVPVGQHAVLVDAGLVGEGVGPHHALVGLHRVAGQQADQARGAGDLARVHGAGVAHGGAVGAQHHGDLLHGAVAGPLADAVDGHLDLAGARPHGRDRRGDRDAEVVVAVHAPDHVAGPWYLLLEPGDQLGELVGQHVADRVRHVDGGRPGRDGRPVDLLEEGRVRAGGVLGRELHVRGVGAGPLDRRRGPGQDLRRGHAQLVLHVDGAGGDEGVDAEALGRGQRVAGPVHVLGPGPGQGGDDRPLDPPGHGLDGFEVAHRGLREAGLDHVDAQPGQLFGDLYLRLRVQVDAWCLLAVAQCGVEDDDAVARGGGGVRCVHAQRSSSRVWAPGTQPP
jgi:hypothetical protein